MDKHAFRCVRSCRSQGPGRRRVIRSRKFASTAQLLRPQSKDEEERPPRTTSFGFQDVLESEKASKVRGVFSSVAPSYDTMNDLMSMGVHRVWKDHFVRSLNPGNPKKPQRYLDVAGGTGDIALRILDHATGINNDHQSSVIISDINPEMLAEGRKRCLQQYPHYYPCDDSLSTEGSHQPATPSRINFLLADAHHFPPQEGTPAPGSIDLYTIAFGIRNFTSIPTALATAYRLLKPGGVFACLEFTPRLSNPILNGLYKRWSFGAIPLIGQIVAGDRDSYQYLVESIERFPDQQTFASMIEHAGFHLPTQSTFSGSSVPWVDLTGGIAAIHKGVKPLSASS